ncbi:ABC transporter ATP-binding protein [Peloplasma aerotolerans]|uniref:ABC transporter ATP-binding protein n=1 Tax=Peloplasma aerotolerans TaxID=3044389 RepID=A0AAW6U4L9_9MOLU|nr:ABC transporter ATP-binding protein [Mariniplasma sp. M4Ah]MDI6452867.1 ABC transporter ATP-binding protein [Mariniplasma sp. M4Ah]MDR4968252.1 ABC transporter ATP-binding protein [Acholeplasmataceae bacterium]
MKMILRLVKPYWRMLTISLTFKSVGALADLFLPWMIAYMIDKEIPRLQADSTSNLNSLYMLGGAMVVIAFLGLYLNVAANRKAEMIAALAVKQLRHDLFSKIEGLSAYQVDALTRPSLISRMTTDTYNIYHATAVMQRLGVRAPVLLIGGILMSLLMDPMMTLIMVAMLPLIIIIVYFYSRKGIPLYKKTQKYIDLMIRKLREYISGARVVRALSMNEHEKEMFNNANQDTVDAELTATITMAKINPLMQTVMNIGLILVLIVGAYRLSAGLVEIGQIMAFVTYFTIILNAMMSITRIFVMSSRATASGERIDEVLNLPVDMKDGTKSVEVREEVPHIEFRNVSFSYTQKESNLTNVSFKLYKGQTLGIIGATGSGKTTIINLLMRFYDVDSGEILIYGQNIKDIKQNDLRKRIGVVFQNDLIFADSIYGNIQFNRNVITNDDIELATRVAQAEFIYDKEDDMNLQMAQRGMNLSGGQKQRVLIARAVAGKPDIMVLDDASSALDYQTDMRMRLSLKKELKKTTMIIIAQRISSLRNSDLILLVDEGKILASGTHDELMQSSVMYQEIAYYQLGGEHS